MIRQMPQFCVCLHNLCPQDLHFRYPSFPVVPEMLVDFVNFAPEKVFWILDSYSATGLNSISSHVLKICSAALAHSLSTIFTLSFVLGYLPYTWKSDITALYKKGAKKKRKTKRKNHQQGHGIHHQSWHINFPFFQLPHLRSPIWFQTRSLHLGHAACTHPTINGGPQYQTWDQSCLSWHILCFWYSMESCLAL